MARKRSSSFPGEIRATVNFKRVDPTQVHEGRISDGRLFAASHVERVDPAQVHEGRVCDLGTLGHVEILDPTQMH